MNRATRRLILSVRPRDRASHPARRRVILRKVLLAGGIVSSVLYIASDVLASLRYEGHSYRDQSFSELLAAGSPVRPLMIGLCAIPYAVLVTAFGVGVWTSAGPTCAARVMGALLVGYALIGLAGGVLFRMNTPAVLAAGQEDWRSTLHVLIAGVQSLLLLVGMGVGATLVDRRFRWYTIGTVLTLLAFGGLACLQAGAVEANEPTPWLGVTERVNIYATMLWVAVLAGSLLRAHGSSAPRQLRKPRVVPQGVAR